MTFDFRWTCSAPGRVFYEVTGDGSAYEAAVRIKAGDFERAIFNGDAAEWTRDVVGEVGVFHRERDPHLPIADSVVAAFNRWRASEHASLVAQLRADPERYGVLDDDDPLLAAPVSAKGGYYETGHGWRTSEGSHEQHRGSAA